MNQCGNWPVLSRAFAKIAAPFISLTIVIVGHGLATTLTTVKMHQAGFNPQLIGIVSSLYYLGLVVGSFRIEQFVVRVGHIRAYAAFASIFTVTMLMQPIWMNIFYWAFLRLIYGYCIAGLFVVIESWFLTESESEIRGQILSLYMISYYGAYSMGQYFLKLEPYCSVSLFSITALLAAFSVYPLAATRVDSPSISSPEKLDLMEFFRTSPTSMVGGFAGGVYTSVVLSLLPLYIGFSPKHAQLVPYLMAITVIGGMFFQLPIGKLSDVMDRRKILLLSFAVSGIFSLFCYADNPIQGRYQELIFFTFGGITATVYPLSINLICDNVSSNKIIAATQCMLFAYSVGCVIGPSLAPLFGDETQIGLFLFMSVVSIFSIIITTMRIIVNAPVPNSDKDQYVPATPIQTASAPELSPNVENSEESVYEKC